MIIHPICNVRGVSREPSHAGSLDALQVYLLFVNISFSHLNKPVLPKKSMEHLVDILYFSPQLSDSAPGD